MQIIYAHQPIPKNIPSIFLAGPTPRDKDTKSWRPEAIEILKKLNFNGAVFIPEDEGYVCNGNHDNQIEWEWEGLRVATCIVFWIPRELQHMPAFTTNIEWGRWYESGKVVLGYPDNTPKMNYLKYCAQKNNVPISNNLTDTLKSALEKIN
jgi:hypothetical protein